MAKKLPISPMVFIAPLVYALFMQRLFTMVTWRDLLSVMTVSFLFFIPVAVGAITIYFSSETNARNWAYRIIVPWIPLFAFVVITLVTYTEGWACWIMVLPLFMVACSIGGLIGGYLKIRKIERNGNIQISIIALLPLFLSPLENFIGTIPGTYEAYTSIDIQAADSTIWENVTRVAEIPEKQDKGYLTNFLGFPRPVKAELNYEGVGAYREAIFTNGLVFHETVSQYTHQKKMVFSIKAYPHEIPSATMDEHVVIGGKFFDVLNGTYELEKLDNKSYRLHLYSHFKMNTTFNFYASWWAKWIMKDIQNNILQVVKQRSESNMVKQI